MKILTVIAVLFITNTVIAKQKYYKWTDENGSIHYSTEKPENNPTDELEISTKQPLAPVQPKKAEPDASKNHRKKAIWNNVEKRKPKPKNWPVKTVNAA